MPPDPLARYRDEEIADPEVAEAYRRGRDAAHALRAEDRLAALVNGDKQARERDDKTGHIIITPEEQP